MPSAKDSLKERLARYRQIIRSCLCSGQSLTSHARWFAANDLTVNILSPAKWVLPSMLARPTAFWLQANSVSPHLVFACLRQNSSRL